MGYLTHSPAPPKTVSSPVDLQGLVVRVDNGFERTVMTDQEICDDVLATIPKLKAAAMKDTFGRRWKQRKRENGVDMFELAAGGGDDPDDDLDIAHALVAKTELRCHLNEVLNVLVNQHSQDYEASMKSLCGKKMKRGQVLFKQRRKIRLQLRGAKNIEHSRTPSNDAAAASGPQDGLVSVQAMTIRPKVPVRMSTKHKPTQQLVFASATLQYATKDRAIHVMKTLPKPCHDQLVSSDDRTALRRRVDHLAVGIDIQSVHGSYSARSHSTRIFLYTYASAVAPTRYASSTNDRHRVATPEEIAQQRKAVMNPEARHVMDILTKSLRQYETVIRRRRFGFQSFVYFSTGADVTPENCFVCRKRFRFYRRDLFCQLCGHVVCGDCSQKYEVEPRVGEIRKNRCCIQCVVRVDNCVFDDEDLLSALGPAVVDADESSWNESYPILSDYDLDSEHDRASVGSSIRSLEDISDSLYSHDPTARSTALEKLAQLVRPAAPHRVSGTPLKPKQVLQEVDFHVRASVQNARPQFPVEKCPVYGQEHDYAYTFGDKAPLAPMPAPRKEAQRLAFLSQSGVLEKDYDHTALDLLARLAAKHLKCEIGYVSVIDTHEQRIVGAYNYPEAASVVPRDETLCMHGVYAETPMVLKNPRRDLRFAQLPVTKEHNFQFYAGFPIRAPDGSVVASLCAGDTTPHANISTKDYATMEVLANLASEILIPRHGADFDKPVSVCV